MSASVQELLLAANAKAKPNWASGLADLIDSGVKGYGTGLQYGGLQAENDLRRAQITKLLQEKQQEDQAMALSKQLEEQFAMQSEQNLRGLAQKVAAPGMPSNPATRLQKVIDYDSKGLPRVQFKIVEPKAPQPGENYTKAQLLATGVDPARVESLATQYGDAIPKEAVALAEGTAQRAISEADRQAAAETAKQGKITTAETSLRNSLTQLRGDTALKTSETQRDASIQGYNQIQKILDADRLPSQNEFNVLVGHLADATGAPAVNPATFKGNIAKAYTFYTGKPGAVGTKEALVDLQNIFKDQGLAADITHEAYMKPRLAKPSGLPEANYQNIVGEGRGLTFQKATGVIPEVAKIKVIRLSDNQPGTINASDFDSTKYKRR